LTVSCDPQRFLVELRAEGPGPPAVVRLRRWLKTALRQHGLRCVSVREAAGPARPKACLTRTVIV
jgi:hypothetical protein